MNLTKQNLQKRARRAHRTRVRVRGTAERPRLSVHRSLQHISAQLIDDDKAITLIMMTDRHVQISTDIPFTGGKKVKTAFALGQTLAEKAGALGITAAVFDRGPYRYHGQVKAVAAGARAGGLRF